MRITFLICAALLYTTGHVGAADYYVGPQGTPTGQGTRRAPWDIESTLAGGRGVRAGDTVYLLAGAYRRRPDELYEVKLTGTADKPINVRPAPDEHVIIDGGLRVVDPSAYLWIWGLEIMVSEPQPAQLVGPGSAPADFTRPWGGLNIYGGTNCRFIDLVIHDCRQGVSWWVGSHDSELYGCIIYDNGWAATDRGHGHAIYTQNNTGAKTIADCIMTGGHGFTLHAYGSAHADVDNYVAEGNICYNANEFLIGGGKPSHNIRVLQNYLYGVPLQLGYAAPYNEDCEIRDNVIVNGGLLIKNYRKVVNEGNLILSQTDPRPPGTRVVLRPNKYDPSRANLAIFNWDKQTEVPVDASALLKAGDHYRLMNPRNLYGKPVLEGVYHDHLSVPTPSEFAAFVLLKSK